MFYVYFWLRYSGTPYYVGKGKDNRAFINRDHCVKKPSLDRILLQEYESEADAFAAEMFFINFYGRLDLGTGCLRNRSGGGAGGATNIGRVFSEEWRRRLGDVARGKKFTPEHRAKLGLKGELNPNFGKKCITSEETRLKISNALKGRKHSAEHRAKNSAARKGRKLSEDQVRKIKERMTGERHPLFGVKMSEETKRKISESNKRRWAQKCLSEEK